MKKDKLFTGAVLLGSAVLLAGVAYISSLNNSNSYIVSTTVKSHLHYKQLERGTIVVAPEEWNLVTREGHICEVDQWRYTSVDDGDEINVLIQKSPYSDELICLGVG